MYSWPWLAESYNLIWYFDPVLSVDYSNAGAHFLKFATCMTTFHLLPILINITNQNNLHTSAPCISTQELCWIQNVPSICMQQSIEKHDAATICDLHVSSAHKLLL